MKANYHNNRYMRKARRKALLDGSLEADEGRKREQFLFNLLTASVIAILKNWGITKPEKPIATILRIIK